MWSCGSCPPAGDVVVQHHLDVLIGDNVKARGVVAGARLGIDVDDFAVPLILKQQASLVVRNDLEVGRGVRRRGLGFPVEEREVRGLWQQAPLAVKDGLHVFGLKPVRKVDVP